MPRRNKKFRKTLGRYPKTVTTVVMASLFVAGFLIFGGNDATDSSQPSAENSSSSKVITKKSSGSSSGNSVSQGGAIDSRGTAATSPPSSSSVSSASGKVTLISPVAGSTLNSGDTVSGTAKISVVQYRLVDDSVGVLAQGQLSVVSGKFSGNLHFSPHATTGQLEIFSYDKNGAEVNSIQINIKLGS